MENTALYTRKISIPFERTSVVDLMLSTLRFFYVMSFAITLINPAIAGRTLYLYLLLPLLDMEFLIKVSQVRVSMTRFISFYALLLLLMLSLHDLSFTIKYSLLLFQVVYLLFLTKKNLATYLFVTLCAHIIFALLQMGLFFMRPDLVKFVTPTFIANLIWGEELSTATFANFGFEFLLPRFSGLYRESGFFASYLMGLYLFFESDKEFRFRTTALVLIFVGIVLSFSKISIAIILIIILNCFRKYLNKIPLYISCILYLVVFHIISIAVFDHILGTYAYDSFGAMISIMHRMLSYYGLQFFDAWNMFFGISGYSSMPAAIRGVADTLFSEIGGLTEPFLFCGLAGILYKGGIIGFISFMAYLSYMRVRTAPFLVLLFLTFTVTLETLQSFVVLGWFYVLKDTWFARGLQARFQGERRNALYPGH